MTRHLYHIFALNTGVFASIVHKLLSCVHTTNSSFDVLAHANSQQNSSCTMFEFVCKAAK